MPGVSKEQITEAREVDLLAYLQSHEPDAIKRTGPNSYRHTVHESLVFHRDYWFWNRTGKRMNALDYLVEIRGLRFVAAVETLCSLRASPSYSLSVAAQQQKRQEPPKPFKLPWVCKCATQAISYLQQRGIHSDIISRCFQDGSIYQSRFKGFYKKEFWDVGVCVFVGRDEADKAKFAAMRGIGGNFKRNVTSSDKRYSFCYPAEQPGSRHLAVFESSIDALSHATLQKLEGWQWNGHRLSLDGPSYVAVVSFLERHPEITRVMLHLDNDTAGLTNARRIKGRLREDKRFSHIRVSINPPRMGKDYNEKLMLTIEQKKEQEQTRRQKEAAILL